MEGKISENIINTFIYACYNNETGLVRSLETLWKYTPHNFRVIVIYNGTDENLYSIIKDKVHLFIHSYRNLGFAKSMNTGIQLANTPYITICNDDVELIHNSWWDDVIKVFNSNPYIGAVNLNSPRLPKHTGEFYEHFPYKSEYTNEDYQAIQKIFGNGVCDGICMWWTTFKKEVFDQVGLLDESFGAGSGEDYDMCRRMGLANWRAVGAFGILAWHWWGKTKNNMPVVKGEDPNLTNYNLILKGNQRMSEKWGQAIDQTPDRTGWDVQGKSGPKKPLNKEYINDKFYDIVPL